MNEMKKNLYAEVAAGGFSRADTTVEFFNRINALVAPDSVIVDFGAGRGQFMDTDLTYRQRLQNLRGKVSEVVGLDVDEAVLQNPSVDWGYVLDSSGRWPLEDASVDLIFSDWTLEHVENPGVVGVEAARVLKDGGWFCARTPNLHGYIAVASRLVPDRMQSRVLAKAQPHRESRDVFPTRYLLNTRASVQEHFPDFQVIEYGVFGEPAYFGSSRLAWRFVQLAHRLLPNRFAPVSLFFCQRRDRSGRNAP